MYDYNPINPFYGFVTDQDLQQRLEVKFSEMQIVLGSSQLQMFTFLLSPGISPALPIGNKKNK